MKRNLFTILSIMAALQGAVALNAHANVPKNDAGWEQIKDSENLKVWKKEVDGSPVVAFRGEAVIDASIAKVAQVLNDTSRKTEWVAHCEEARDVRPISPWERIEYNHTGTPIVLKDREFLFNAKVSIDKPNRAMDITLHSVDDPALPDSGKYVRGKLLESSYHLQSIDGGKRTVVTVEIHADPMGSVPKWIVNLFQKGWPSDTLEGIRKQCAKSDVPEEPRVKAIFDDLWKNGGAAKAVKTSA